MVSGPQRACRQNNLEAVPHTKAVQAAFVVVREAA